MQIPHHMCRNLQHVFHVLLLVSYLWFFGNNSFLHCHSKNGNKSRNCEGVDGHSSSGAFQLELSVN